MSSHRKPRFQNHIYSLRRGRRYEQKHLARLLGYRGAPSISRYETGAALPPLRTALLLEIVLGARLPEIYVDLYHELERVALARSAQLPQDLGRHVRRRVLGKE